MIKPMATFNGYLNVAEEGSRPKSKRKGMKHSQNDSGRGKRERERERECTIQLPVYFLFHVFAIRRYTKQIADELDDCTILCTVRNVDSEKSTRIAHANYVFFSHKNVKSAQILSSWYWVRNGTLWKVDFFY